MGLKINAKKAVELSGYNAKFKESLTDVIKWASKDPDITDVRQLAYILATAKIESGYFLGRWESDYLCGSIGSKLTGYPCQRALDYYRSTSGKKDYYTLGLDPNGQPYFGRGLIQLTGKGNYDYYGKKLGLNLLKYPNLALKPRNSYNIAVAYMHRRGTFDKVFKNDLHGARRTIGSGNNEAEVSHAYRYWLGILNKSEKKTIFGSVGGNQSSGTKSNAGVIAISLASALIVAGVAIVILRKASK